jgi:hypothetical protein
MRPPRCVLLALCAVALGACRREESREDARLGVDALPPAVIAAPSALTTDSVATPPAQAPTAPGVYTSMSPPSTQQTPPRPKTRRADDPHP